MDNIIPIMPRFRGALSTPDHDEDDRVINEFLRLEMSRAVHIYCNTVGARRATADVLSVIINSYAPEAKRNEAS